MTPRLYFWTFAWLVFSSLIGVALLGYFEIRRGRLDRHRRLMHLAIVLVGLFVLAYAGKLLLLGREDLSAWSREAIWTLRFHETVVALMLLSGGLARFLARRVPGKSSVVEAASQLPKAHRLLGRVALISGVLALLTASVVLVGMYQRAV